MASVTWFTSSAPCNLVIYMIRTYIWSEELSGTSTGFFLCKVASVHSSFEFSFDNLTLLLPSLLHLYPGMSLILNYAEKLSNEVLKKSLFPLLNGCNCCRFAGIRSFIWSSWVVSAKRWPTSTNQPREPWPDCTVIKLFSTSSSVHSLSKSSIICLRPLRIRLNIDPK